MPPLVAGGQGRTAEDVTASGRALSELLAAALLAAVVVVARWLLAGAAGPGGAQ